MNPTQFIDLKKTVKADRERCKLVKDQSGWLHAPGSGESNLKFVYWEDKPKGMITYVQNKTVVTNLVQVMYRGGLKHRFFALFNTKDKKTSLEKNNHGR